MSAQLAQAIIGLECSSARRKQLLHRFEMGCMSRSGRNSECALTISVSILASSWQRPDAISLWTGGTIVSMRFKVSVTISLTWILQRLYE